MTDPSRHDGAVHRGLTVSEVEGRYRTVLTLGRNLDAAVEVVWRACTTTAGLAPWFTPVSGDLRLGGRYRLEGGPGGTIAACEAPTAFTVSWETGEDVARVSVTLTAMDGGRTRLVLEHAADVPDELWRRYGPGGAGVGWDLTLVGLGRHLAAESHDREEALAWRGSAPGRAVTAVAARRWADAAVGAGVPRPAARAAQEQTVALYLGTAAAG